MQNLRNALNDLQEKTIGIAKVCGGIELVIDETDYNFTAVSIGDLGGLCETHYSKSDFSFKKFDATIGNLKTFLETPLEFNNWYVENIL